jgi:hypothetical protein
MWRTACDQPRTHLQRASCRLRSAPFFMQGGCRCRIVQGGCSNSTTHSAHACMQGCGVRAAQHCRPLGGADALACMQVVVIMYALHQIVGLWASLAGVAAMVAVAPLQMLLGMLEHRFRSTLIAKTDARVKIMSEVINGTRARKACLHACYPSRPHRATGDTLCPETRYAAPVRA